MARRCPLLPPFPDPDAVAVVIAKDGAQLGPFSRRDLAARLASGEIATSDHFFYDGMTEWAVIADAPGLVPAPPALPARTADAEQLEQVFGRLVKESWAYYDARAYAQRVDELLLGAVITCTLDNGYALIDLASDGAHHNLRFQHPKEGHRILCRLTHLTPDLTTAKVLGHRASVVLGYGERLDDFTRIFNALRAEVKSGYLQSAEPGTIVVDGDMNTGYIYVQVDLYLNVDDYVGPNYKINYDVLREHLAATLHTLRKYLRGRFAS